MQINNLNIGHLETFAGGWVGYLASGSISGSIAGAAIGQQFSSRETFERRFAGATLIALLALTYLGHQTSPMTMTALATNVCFSKFLKKAKIKDAKAKIKDAIVLTTPMLSYAVTSSVFQANPLDIALLSASLFFHIINLGSHTE